MQLQTTYLIFSRIKTKEQEEASRMLLSNEVKNINEFINKYKDDYEIYKTNYLNNLEKLFIENEEKYLNKYKNSKSKLAKKLNLNYFIRRFRKIYLKN